MPTCSLTPRAELEQEVMLLMRQLELQQVSSPEQLKKHFRTLIKQYHPDQFKGCEAEAHLRSQKIISAHRRLVQIMKLYPGVILNRSAPDLAGHKNSIQQTAPDFRSAKAAGGHSRTASPGTADPVSHFNNLRSMQFQLFESAEACYGIPLAAIERITAMGFSQQDDSKIMLNTCFRPMYSHGHENRYIEAGQLDWQEFKYVILLRQAGGQLLGLAMARDLEPGSIVQIHPGQASIFNPGGRNPGLFFCSNDKHYFCPDDLAFRFLTRQGF